MSSALDGTRARGIDVYHGHPVVSWSELEAAPENIALIGIKASEGMTFTDPKLLWHREGFRASTLDLAVYYHFAEPGDPRVQARRFVDIVGPLGPRERMCLDLERSPLVVPNAGLDLDWVDQFYDELAGGLCTDRRHFIYTSKNKWDEICGGKPWLFGTTEVELWAKRYSTGADLEPMLPEPWKDRGWHIWQFSDGVIPHHSIAGVGTCDGDVWNGNRDVLRGYIAASSTPALPATS
jgi:GH25 family lysozyme M1 (1,4-beta-N-acetylmuramidase)